jgi:hypothetical protein
MYVDINGAGTRIWRCLNGLATHARKINRTHTARLLPVGIVTDLNCGSVASAKPRGLFVVPVVNRTPGNTDYVTGLTSALDLIIVTTDRQSGRARATKR